MCGHQRQQVYHHWVEASSMTLYWDLVNRSCWSYRVHPIYPQKQTFSPRLKRLSVHSNRRDCSQTFEPLSNRIGIDPPNLIGTTLSRAPSRNLYHHKCTYFPHIIFDLPLFMHHNAMKGPWFRGLTNRFQFHPQVIWFFLIKDLRLCDLSLNL